MSKVIAAPPTHAAPGPLPAPAGPLRRVRRIGYVVLGFQLAGFLVWSTILYRRFALTWDFSAYHQAWYLIAHGNLDPYNSIERMPFWRNDSEFAVWPLAPFYWLWPHDMLLLWLQDFGVVAAGSGGLHLDMRGWRGTAVESGMRPGSLAWALCCLSPTRGCGGRFRSMSIWKT